MSKTLFVLFCSILILLPINAIAIGVVPGKLTMPFVPFHEEDIIFDIWGPTDVKAETNCPDIITIDNIIRANGASRAKVSAHIKLPERLEPGKKSCGISFAERPNKDIPLGTTVTVVAVLEIDVPYPGKYAMLSLTAPNAMPNEDLKIYATITNLGTDTLDAYADIIIKDYQNNTIKVRKTYVKRLGSKETGSFGTTFAAGTLESGKYIAKAIFDYDSGFTSDEKHFVIGMLGIELKNYTKEIASKAISPFEVTVTSLWGNPLEDVFAEIKILDPKTNSTVSAKTPSITLLPYGTEAIEGFIDARNLEPGNYQAEIILHTKEGSFSNKAEIKIFENKVEASMPLFTNPYIFLVLIFAIVLTDAAYMYMLRKNYHHPDNKGQAGEMPP